MGRAAATGRGRIGAVMESQVNPKYCPHCGAIAQWYGIATIHRHFSCSKCGADCSDLLDPPEEYEVFLDGDQWCAVRPDFINLQESPSGFGDTKDKAIAALIADERRQAAEV